MARIAGVDLPSDKRIEVGLTYIFGIGPTTAQKILSEAGINPDTRVKNLTDDVYFIHINISATTCINRIASVMNKFNMPENFINITLKNSHNSETGE